MQALKLTARKVTLHARGAGVDHVADARHGQRGFGDVGREHDAPLRSRLEHAILLGCGQARVQGEHFGRSVVAPRQREVRIADLAFAREEDQRIAARVFVRDLVDGGNDLLDLGRNVAFRSGRQTVATFGRGAASW